MQKMCAETQTATSPSLLLFQDPTQFMVAVMVSAIIIYFLNIKSFFYHGNLHPNEDSVQDKVPIKELEL